jgi:hypothetical protein
MIRPFIFVALVVALGVLAGACGDDLTFPGSAAPTPTGSPTLTTTPTTPTPTETPLA